MISLAFQFKIFNFLITLGALSILEFLPASEYYRRLVKKLMLETSYKERRKVVSRHTDMLTKKELIDFFQTFSLDHIDDIKEEEERFRLLDILMNDLMFYGENFDNNAIVKNLLGRNEQEFLLDFFNNSNYPYKRSYFDDDEVRRRAWQEKLYYDLFKGHIDSIELICEDNHKEFLDKMEELKSFPKLENLNILFSRTADYESLRQNLPLHLYNVKIYVLDHNFPYLSQIKI